MSDGTRYVNALPGKSQLSSSHGAQRTFRAQQLGLDIASASVTERLEHISRTLLSIQLTCSKKEIMVDLTALLKRNEAKARCTEKEYCELRLLAHAIWRETSGPKNPKKLFVLVTEAIQEPDENPAIPAFKRTQDLQLVNSAKMLLTTVFTKLLTLYREVQDEGMGLRLIEDDEEFEEAPDDERTDPNQTQRPTMDLDTIRQKIISADPNAKIQKMGLYAIENEEQITFSLGNFGIVGIVTISRQGENILLTGNMVGDEPTTWSYELNQFREGACLLLGRAEIAQLLDCGESRAMSAKQMAITMEGETLVVTDMGQGPLQTD
ncbi:MAG: hypothetical protein ABII22_05465 [Candidatus Micrarchaeota archaeon]